MISSQMEGSIFIAMQAWPPKTYEHLKHSVYRNVIVDITFQADHVFAEGKGSCVVQIL